MPNTSTVARLADAFAWRVVHKPHMWRRIPLWAHAALAAAVGAIYFALAVFSIKLIATPHAVAYFWPAAGLASGVVLLLGYQGLPAVAVAVFSASVAVSGYLGYPLPLAVALAAANVIECAVITVLAERHLGIPLQLTTLNRVFGLLVIAACGAGAASLVSSIALLLFFGHESESSLYQMQAWFRSDLIGIVTMTPLILGLATPAHRPLSARDHLESCALLAIVASLSYLAFCHISPTEPHDGSWLHICATAVFPPLLVLALRSSVAYTNAAATGSACMFVIETILRDGTSIASAEQVAVTVGMAQTTILCIVFSSLSLAALTSERRAAEAYQRLLNSELDHRVKNSLALVQAVVERSRVGAQSAEAFFEAVAGRVRALARAHAKISCGPSQGVDLAGIVRDELAPYEDQTTDLISGPPVMLPPAAAQGLVLVLHELATNAVKHGALSTPSGKVMVTWQVKEPEHLLKLVWREFGGPVPPVTPREGFGLSTIRHLLRYETGAHVSLRFLPEGAECEIMMALRPTEPQVNRLVDV